MDDVAFRKLAYRHELIVIINFDQVIFIASLFKWSPEVLSLFGTASMRCLVAFLTHIDRQNNLVRCHILLLFVTFRLL